MELPVGVSRSTYPPFPPLYADQMRLFNSVMVEEILSQLFCEDAYPPDGCHYPLADRWGSEGKPTEMEKSIKRKGDEGNKKDGREMGTEKEARSSITESGKSVKGASHESPMSHPHSKTRNVEGLNGSNNEKHEKETREAQDSTPTLPFSSSSVSQKVYGKGDVLHKTSCAEENTFHTPVEKRKVFLRLPQCWYHKKVKLVGCCESRTALRFHCARKDAWRLAERVEKCVYHAILRKRKQKCSQRT